nr:PREDICTED: uncharacterized protein LOC105674205 [Linepithema humile]
MSSGSSLKCGYCDYILHGSCGNALAHHCFSDFSEHLHAINVDENSVVTMLQRYDSDAEEMEDAANNMSEAIFGTNNPKQTVDELLIDLVHERKALWDHRLSTKERTNLKRNALWNEIVNSLGDKIISLYY